MTSTKYVGDNTAEARALTLLAQKRSELNTLVEHSNLLKRYIQELEFVAAGGEKGSKDIIENLRRAGLDGAAPGYSKNGKKMGRPATKKPHSAPIQLMEPWTEEEDQIIVDAFKSKNEPYSAAAASHDIETKIHRTNGAIRQRIYRLATKGGPLRRNTKRGTGTGKPVMLEVA